MVASECAPFAKTGGLADAVAGLSSALARLGHHVTLVLPGYRGLSADAVDAGYVFVPLGFETRTVQLRGLTTADGVQLILVDDPAFATRDTFYGESGADYPDNAARFALLSRVALAYAVREDTQPFDVLHAHDWHASLAPVFHKTRYAGHPRSPRGSVFTIHNLAFQGLFDVGELPSFDLDPRLFSIEGLEYWGRASALKGGCVFADWVTTVSPSYCRETVETELGFGFQGILRSRAGRYVGILNGIDTEVWNPARDRYLPQPYSAADMSKKVASKIEVLQASGLDPATGNDGPLVGMVTRLAHQKGTDLAGAIAPWLVNHARLVLLGAGDPPLEDAWRRLAAEYPKSIGVHIGFDERLAHLIEAGADIFLMPSRYEPCGLNQMYSLKYGTVPIVHRTGGLADTVKTWSPRTGKGNGFAFETHDATGLRWAVEAALTTYKDQAQWQRLVANGMAEDYSWNAQGKLYERVYERLTSSKAHRA